MKEKAKRLIIHLLIGAVILLGGLAFFNHQTSSDKEEGFSEMANSSYPIMTIRTEDGEYDIMSAYVDSVDLSLVRNQIAVVGNDRKIELSLHNYNYDITAIQYSLFLKSEDKILEEGTLNKLEESKEDGVRSATIQLQTNLDKGKSYYLKLSTRLDKDTKVYYYTKVQNGEGCHFKECKDFAEKFHKNLFDKENFDENITYLEPSGKVTKSLENVDITSSVDAISFGNVKVKKESEPTLTVKEINEVYCVLQYDYILSSEIKEGVIQYYNTCEKYKIRYTSDRMYLLDYSRTMDAFYNKAMYDPAKNYVTLGIGNLSNVDILSSDSGNKVCFSQSGQLWYYNYKSSDVAKVFSFSSENLGDIRNTQKNHGIKLLKMDDKGNIVYILYGYINRGCYEGRNGIQLLRYNAEKRCNEELGFFATSVPYDQMKEDVAKLTYLNSKNIFYCILDGDLHAVDIKNHKDSILHSGMVNENITASKGESIIAVEENKDLGQNTSVRMIDLESGKEQVFSCESNERLHAVGFLANDFIYGIAKASNVKSGSGDATVFPMDYLKIVDIDGKELKRYSKTNRFILKTDISGSVLEMEFGKKSGNKIVSTSDKDYIRYKVEEETGEVSLIYDYSNTYWNQMSLKFPNYVYVQVEPDLIMTKILESEDNQLVELERTRASKTMYYVYSEGMEKASYDNLKEAILEATELRGNVISSDEQTMWESGYISYAMVAGMDKVTKVKNNKESLQGCIAMIAQVNGKQVDYKKISKKGKTVTELMEEYSGKTSFNLTGCTLDEILYFIGKGSPVVAKYNNGRYVIVMSYNSSKVRYLDPVTGLSTVTDRVELNSIFTKQGNEFYTYLE